MAPSNAPAGRLPGGTYRVCAARPGKSTKRATATSSGGQHRAASAGGCLQTGGAAKPSGLVRPCSGPAGAWPAPSSHVRGFLWYCYQVRRAGAGQPCGLGAVASWAGTRAVPGQSNGQWSEGHGITRPCGRTRAPARPPSPAPPRCSPTARSWRRRGSSPRGSALVPWTRTDGATPSADHGGVDALVGLAEIAEDRMLPAPVVPGPDGGDAGAAARRPRSPRLTVNQLTFEGHEEATDSAGCTPASRSWGGA